VTKEWLRVAVIGAGAMGTIHARHLASSVPGARLAAIADVDASRAAALAEECEASRIETDAGAIFADPSIEAVVVASPPNTHGALIERAAAAGKHVFCEKPVDSDPDMTDRALAAASRAGIKLQIGFNRRFDPTFRAVHSAIEAGRLGRPLLLHLFSRDPRPTAVSSTRAIAGLFLDMTIHDFDMARFLMQSEVTQVYALAGTMMENCGEPDTAIVTLRFTSGAIATIDNAHTAYGYDQRVEVFGTDGCIATENEQPDRARLVHADGRIDALPLYFFGERYLASYLAELRAFVHCIQNDGEPAVTGQDGRAAAKVAAAAQRSYETGQPVRMSEIG
jgi:myo-inositol 2-dehydrogenase/D-chiro-inositol 1-dehydrogenase